MAYVELKSYIFKLGKGLGDHRCFFCYNASDVGRWRLNEVAKSWPLLPWKFLLKRKPDVIPRHLIREFDNSKIRNFDFRGHYSNSPVAGLYLSLLCVFVPVPIV